VCRSAARRAGAALARGIHLVLQGDSTDDGHGGPSDCRNVSPVGRGRLRARSATHFWFRSPGSTGTFPAPGRCPRTGRAARVPAGRRLLRKHLGLLAARLPCPGRSGAGRTCRRARRRGVLCPYLQGGDAGPCAAGCFRHDERVADGHRGLRTGHRGCRDEETGAIAGGSAGDAGSDVATRRCPGFFVHGRNCFRVPRLNGGSTAAPAHPLPFAVRLEHQVFDATGNSAATAGSFGSGVPAFTPRRQAAPRPEAARSRPSPTPRSLGISRESVAT
jgi:hypothetical protein